MKRRAFFCAIAYLTFLLIPILPASAQLAGLNFGYSDPRAKTAKLKQFVDFTFIKELNGRGFINGLYKKK
jgi:hypothetical protein